MLHFFINHSQKGKLNVFQVLSKVPGLGLHKIVFICKRSGLLLNCPWNILSESQMQSLATWIEENFVGDHSVSLDFKKIQKERILFLKRLRHYKGMRLALGLPARGQNTHSNGKTAKKLCLKLPFLFSIFHATTPI